MKLKIERNHLHIFYAGNKHRYSIAICNLADKCKHNPFPGKDVKIAIDNISFWAVQLAKKPAFTNESDIEMFIQKVNELIPGNTIDWEITKKAISLVKEFYFSE